MDHQNMHTRHRQQVNSAGLLKGELRASVQTGFPPQKQGLG